MPNRTLSWLRLLGRLEGISYLLLLGVAMPLKYLAGYSAATKIAGWPHGLLFVAYCVMVALAGYRLRLRPTLIAALFLASLLPFGPFVVERWLEPDSADNG